MNDDQFFGWWNGDDLTPDNDFPKDSPIWWAWEGWQAANRQPWVKTYSGGKPNYTQPIEKEWVGLTDDEIYAVENEYLVNSRIPVGCGLYFAKDIEAKLREKNA